jgi:hypothetical protein
MNTPKTDGSEARRTTWHMHVGPSDQAEPAIKVMVLAED